MLNKLTDLQSIISADVYFNHKSNLEKTIFTKKTKDSTLHLIKKKDNGPYMVVEHSLEEKCGICIKEKELKK